MAHPTAPAATSTDARLDQITRVLQLMLETQQTHTEMLAQVIEAATPTRESSLEAAMRSIAAALTQQTDGLARVEQELQNLGPEIEAGVMRGLTAALGIEPEAEDGRVAQSPPGLPSAPRAPATTPPASTPGRSR